MAFIKHKNYINLLISNGGLKVENIRRNIANYLADVWCINIEDYEDYTTKDLLKMLHDNNYYDDFIGYIS